MSEKEIHRIGLTLNMNNSMHRQAWQLLKVIPVGKRTEYICQKITGEQEIAKTVYENTLKALKEYGGGITPAPVIETDLDEAEEIDRNFFGFLASLE